jgi:hypothetical protein
VQGVHGKHNFDNPTVKQALQREDRELWVAAINAELRSIFEKDVYDECVLPAGKRALTTRMVLHIKRDQWGNVLKYKARLVARGFLQEEGIFLTYLPQLHNLHPCECLLRLQYSESFQCIRLTFQQLFSMVS